MRYIIILILIITAVGAYYLLNQNKKKSYEELKSDAQIILNTLSLPEQDKKRFLRLINAKKQKLLKMQNALKFLISEGLNLT